MGLKMMVNYLTPVHHLLLIWLISEQPFQSIVGLKTLGDLWAMLWEMLRWFLDWQLLQLTTTIGLFGLCTGLHRAPCSGLSLFLAMIGNHIKHLNLLLNLQYCFLGLHFFSKKSRIYSSFPCVNFKSNLNTNLYMYFLVWIVLHFNFAVVMGASLITLISIAWWDISFILQSLYLIMDG